MVKKSYTQTPIGVYQLCFLEEQLIAVNLVPEQADSDAAPYIERIQREFERYFSDPSHQFKLDWAPAPTAFQSKLRDLLLSIPLGDTLTYGDAAKALKTSPRAIGNACRANPLPIVVPCHRIVSKDGLGGYAGERAGDMLDRKRWLLRHEGVEV